MTGNILILAGALALFVLVDLARAIHHRHQPCPICGHSNGCHVQGTCCIFPCECGHQRDYKPERKTP